MSVLWCGGEDVDFPNGSAVSINTGGGFRAGYARCAIYQNTNGAHSKSTVFPGGPVTSCWVSAQLSNGGGGYDVSERLLGICRSGTEKGIFFGTAASNGNKIALVKYDGTTQTELAAETGTSMPGSVTRMDMQIISFGASSTVNIYINGTIRLNYVGSTAISGISDLDSIYLAKTTGNASVNLQASEIIVADEDTRAWPGLQTNALTGAGTTNQWSGNTFSNINGATISDVSPASVNVNAQDQQYNITDLVAGTFKIKAVRIAARVAMSAGAAVTKISLGYNSGGTVSAGTAQPVTTAYTTIERIDGINPITGVYWANSEMNALQLNLRSAA